MINNAYFCDLLLLISTSIKIKLMKEHIHIPRKEITDSNESVLKKR